MTFALQLLSNLRLDTRSKNLPKALAKNVALLGNTLNVESPNFLTHLKEITSRWEHVYFVPGPYELSSKTGTPFWKQHDALFDAQRNVSNLSVMTQLDIHLPNEQIVLLGTPLFQDTSFRHGIACSEEERDIYMNRKQRIGTMQLAQWHWEDKEWLKNRLCWYTRNSPETRAICLTSYSPFASEGMAPMMSTRNGVVSWAYGSSPSPSSSSTSATGSVVFQMKDDVTTVYSVEDETAPILELQ